MYESGWKDGAAVFFYTLICIIMHAILQEYVLDVSALDPIKCTNPTLILLLLIESFEETSLVEVQAVAIQRIWSAGCFLLDVILMGS
jgi:TRAM1-like protein